MSQGVLPPHDPRYPESDGRLVGRSTRQTAARFYLYTALSAHFDGQAVFVACGLFWYPVRGRPDVRHDPDLMVVVGRPYQPRRCYKQWEEGDISPRVLIEVASPTGARGRRRFADSHGVSEYIEYDPHRVVMRVWTRTADRLRPVGRKVVYDSPALGLRLACLGDDPLRVYTPDGYRYPPLHELAARRPFVPAPDA